MNRAMQKSARQQAKGKTGHQRKLMAREAVIDALEGDADGMLAEWVMKTYEQHLLIRGIGLMTLSEWLAQESGADE
jgi:hypothetical protein